MKGYLAYTWRMAEGSATMMTFWDEHVYIMGIIDIMPSLSRSTEEPMRAIIISNVVIKLIKRRRWWF